MNICENAGICGGCFYQGVSYEEQLRIKETQVKELMDGAIRTPYVFEPIIPSPLSSAYRNKMEFSFGDCQKDGPLTLGLHQKRSFFNIINTDHCQLTHPDFGLILETTREYFGKLGVPYKHKKSHQGYLRHLLVRRAVKTGEILVDLVTTTQTSYLADAEEVVLEAWKQALLALKEEGRLAGSFAGILHTKNDSRADAIVNDGTEVLFGQDYFFEELLGLRFKITPFSFFQTNSLGAEKLYEKTREYAGVEQFEGDAIGEKPVIYDLYCGTGTISQVMSAVAKQVVGVEIVKEAVEAARENAALNGIANCDFIAGDVLKVIAEGGELIKEDGSFEEAPRPDLIILDPPREGIHAKALAKIIDYGVEKIVYVSCKPQSLARDLTVLQAAGYVVERVCPVDMFPFTNNCETVCLLTREKSVKSYAYVDISTKELGMKAKPNKATYKQIQAYVLEKHGLKVSPLYIAGVKDEYGLEKQYSYKEAGTAAEKRPQCPKEKHDAIVDALIHFGMLDEKDR